MIEPLTPARAGVRSVAEARDLLEAGGDEVGVLGGSPVLAVALDGVPEAEVAALARLVADLPAVVVGLAHEPATSARAAPPLDVLLAGDPAAVPPWRACPEGLDGALADLVAGVAGAPQAATVLVQVLRRGRGRSLEDGLTVESLAYATLQAGTEHRAWLARRDTDRPVTPARPPGAVPAEPVGVHREGDALVVTLRRPHRRNAVDVGVRDGLVAAFDLAARDAAVTRVELRGEGPDFCSGGDLDEFGTTPDPATAHLVRSSRSPARALGRIHQPTTAFVQGAAIGAGIELAALCGRVVATADTWFRLPEIAMGLIPGAGGTATIPRRIGPELTAWMALTGVAVDVATAQRWGLVDEVR